MAELATITFELIEGDSELHGHRLTWVKVRPLAGTELAEVVAGGSRWQTGCMESRMSFPIGTVVRVGGRWDSRNTVEEFPLEPVGGLIGLGLVVDFLAKRADISDLREVARVSTQAEYRAVFSSSEE